MGICEVDVSTNFAILDRVEDAVDGTRWLGIHQIHEIEGWTGQMQVYHIDSVSIESWKRIKCGAAMDCRSGNIGNIISYWQVCRSVAINDYIRSPSKIGEKELTQGKDGNKALSLTGINFKKNSIALAAI